MYPFYPFLERIIPALLILFVIWLILKHKNNKSVTSINPSAPSAVTGVSKIVTIVVKIIAFLILGYAYYVIIGVSSLPANSCIATNCVFLRIGLIIGAFWLLASFVFTSLTILYGKKVLSSRILNIILMPYAAIPIFIGIVVFAGNLAT